MRHFSFIDFSTFPYTKNFPCGFHSIFAWNSKFFRFILWHVGLGALCMAKLICFGSISYQISGQTHYLYKKKIFRDYNLQKTAASLMELSPHGIIRTYCTKGLLIHLNWVQCNLTLFDFNKLIFIRSARLWIAISVVKIVQVREVKMINKEIFYN